MLRGCTTIRHVIEIEFICPTLELQTGEKKTIRQEIQNPYISQGNYYEDWSYTCVHIKCKECDKSHVFEI
jgi:hypothetical protein